MIRTPGEGDAVAVFQILAGPDFAVTGFFQQCSNRLPLVITMLKHQPAARFQNTPGLIGDNPDRIQRVGTRGQRCLRLKATIAFIQMWIIMRDIRRVADDQMESLL